MVARCRVTCKRENGDCCGLRSPDGWDVMRKINVREPRGVDLERYDAGSNVLCNISRWSRGALKNTKTSGLNQVSTEARIY